MKTADDIVADVDTLIKQGQVYIPAGFIQNALEGLYQAAGDAAREDKISREKWEGLIVSLDNISKLVNAAELKHITVPDDLGDLDGEVS